MTRNEILENLCLFDHRNPSEQESIIRKFGLDSKSENEECTCHNCTSGKTKMAVAMLKMINCTNCLNYSRAKICTKCDNYSNWELRK